MSPSLPELGWSQALSFEHSRHAVLIPMRVVVEHQDRYTVLGEDTSFDAHLSGRLLQEANTGGQRPAVGDWVLVSQEGTIQHLCARKTAFVREIRGKPQVIAANIDRVFVVTSCNREFNVRRLERYLAAIWQSGAEPVVVLSKTDLCDDPHVYLDKLAGIVGNTRVYPVATPLGTGLESLESELRFGQTIALVGSSGVGKSTLANALLKSDQLQTAPIREDDAKGRHTTTRRELVVLPDRRGILIDTPGMRELQLSPGRQDLTRAFADIHQLAQRCQFRDCRHDKEPGCAVREAVSKERLASFQLLTREQEIPVKPRRSKRKR